MGKLKGLKPLLILVTLGIFALIVFILNSLLGNNSSLFIDNKNSLYVGGKIWVRFGIFLIVLFAWIAISVLLGMIGPGKYKYRLEDWANENLFYKVDYNKEKWNVVLDTHCHTRRSDGKLTLEKNVFYHLSVGFNAFVITDHNRMPNVKEIKRLNEKYKGKMVIIPGFEYTTLRFHMCIIGITDWGKKIHLYPTDEQIKEVIEEAHRKGGICVIAHYPWSTWGEYPKCPDHPTREQMYNWGVDLIECANWDDDKALIDYTSYEFAKANPNIGLCCGTDMHEPFKDPLCGWTVLKAKDFTADAIIEELKKHNTDVILRNEPARYLIKHKESFWYKILRPFIMFGEKFESIYLGGKISNLDFAAFNAWLSYFFIIFVLIEIVRYIGF